MKTTERFSYSEDQIIEQNYSWQSLAKLLNYIFPYRRKLVGIGSSLFLSVGIKLIIPLLIAYAIDHAMNSYNRQKSLKLLLFIGVSMVVLYVLQTLIHRYRIRRANQVGQLIVSELRTSLFQKILHMPFKSLDKKSTGHIFSRVIGDVNTLEDLLTNGFINSIIDCIKLVGIVTILLIWNFKLGMAIILTVPLMFLVSYLLRRKIRKEFQDLRTKQVQINSHLNEAIQGIKITKAYGQEKNNIQYFNMLNRQHIKIWDKASALNQSFNPIIELACAMGTVILFAYGSYLIQINAITVGTIIGFTSYISNFWEPVNRLGQIYSQLLVCMASSERIFEFMDEKEDRNSQANLIEMPSIQGDVLIEHVQFGYEENQLILDDICFYARPGQTIAIIGVSGAGKSTLVNLLGRHYDIQGGSIFIDGIDIRTVSPHSLRSQISVVLQDTFLFAGTIRENIRFGKLDATDEEIEEVSKIVCIHDTILSLPQGYETELQEQGSSLSIGERQLVSFARALLNNPRILILDEATANVDTETELKIRSAMDRISHNRTTFVIAHRLSTIRYADQIIVMDRGRILESGTHNELMDIGGIYNNYVRKQNMNLSSKV